MSKNEELIEYIMKYIKYCN